MCVCMTYFHFYSIPVQGQVERLIDEATIDENLAQLYVGRLAFIFCLCHSFVHFPGFSYIHNYEYAGWQPWL